MVTKAQMSEWSKKNAALRLKEAETKEKNRKIIIEKVEFITTYGLDAIRELTLERAPYNEISVINAHCGTCLYADNTGNGQTRRCRLLNIEARNRDGACNLYIASTYRFQFGYELAPVLKLLANDEMKRSKEE